MVHSGILYISGRRRGPKRRVAYPSYPTLSTGLDTHFIYNIFLRGPSADENACLWDIKVLACLSLKSHHLHAEKQRIIQYVVSFT